MELSSQINPGTYIFVAKEAIRDTSPDILKSDMLRAFKKVGAIV
jgi:hypothetical protein